MSDSGDDAARPSDHAIEQALRSIVREALKNDEEVTIKIARTRAEEQLGLEDGFFKNASEWKARSKSVIEDAVEEPASPEKTKKAAPKPKAGAKRKSDEAEPPIQKRRKQAAIPDSEDVEPEIVVDEEADKEASEPEDVGAKTKSLPKSVSTSALSSPPGEDEDEDEEKENGNTTAVAQAGDDESDLSSVVDDPPPKKKRQTKPKASTAKPKPTKAAKATKSKKQPSPDVEEPKLADDHSDLSSVLDDPPPKKKAARKSTSTSTTAKPTSAATAKPAKPTKELSPDEEEIKRLQSWLLKCGVRKLWHRELAPFSTSKEKIKHLKGMLEEVGLTGRFSAEKAKGIKEQRELRAELEAVEEYAQQWGKEKGEGDEEEEGGDGEEGKKKAPAVGGRLKPRGLVDFGDSGEESD
ncbi:hypothetical protein LTR09_001389 [Extremus antarcticus]|uniref:Transcriptional regulator n=1 Tax=Extremus antarcticus TaxID=702011 RepID=A0AAJ0LX25_9PEZI|nr:hypothetical protein LTR09_001389 [Extremus antarcticus]